MREEIQKKNAELNEAALSGVSGGDALYDKMDHHAAVMCNICGTNRRHCDGGSQAKLRDYMVEHGEIGSVLNCPYGKP